MTAEHSGRRSGRRCCAGRGSDRPRPTAVGDKPRCLERRLENFSWSEEGVPRGRGVWHDSERSVACAPAPRRHCSDYTRRGRDSLCTEIAPATPRKGSTEPTRTAALPRSARRQGCLGTATTRRVTEMSPSTLSPSRPPPWRAPATTKLGLATTKAAPPASTWSAARSVTRQPSRAAIGEFRPSQLRAQPW